MIVKIDYSPLKNKRFRATMNDNRTIDFGLKKGQTFLDHHSTSLREAYHLRHYANKTEKQLIDNLISSPSLLSYYLLWGPTTSLRRNVELLNALWKQKHSAK